MEPASFLLDTLWDILKNVLGNRADAALFSKESEPTKQATRPAEEQASPPARTFRTFDAANDLPHVLPLVDAPAVHLLVESEPSTFYNLAAFVIESRSTGQWYLFSRWRIALQGSGGGKHNLDTLVEKLRKLSTPVAAWVVRREDLDRFEAGRVLWSSLRPSLVPLVAYRSQSDTWPEIQRRFRELANSPA